MSQIQNYFIRDPKNIPSTPVVENNVFIRSLKRKFSALNDNEKESPHTNKKHSPTREYQNITADENSPLAKNVQPNHIAMVDHEDDQILVSTATEFQPDAIMLLQHNEETLLRQIHDKVITSVH